jgi:hypothetical protein
MLGKFIARDFIAIAGEMRRFPASNENIVRVQVLIVTFHLDIYKNKFKNLIWTSKFKFSFRGLQLHFCAYAISAYHH